MAQFEQKYPVDAYKVYRPNESAKVNAKAWWRYAILAEVYKVRCLQREEMWHIAGNKGMSILSHLRFIIAQKGNMDNIDQEDVNENYVADTMRKLKSLEHVVSDLDRENMALRKMIKTLFTPLARENFTSEELTLQDIEQEIDILESRALNTSKRLEYADSLQSPQSLGSTGGSSFRPGDSMIIDAEEEAECLLLESLTSSVDSPDLNIRSPYEKLLPPIELTQRDMQDPNKSTRKSKGGSPKGSPKSPRLKPINPKDKFPSYLEREAMRKEQAAKKRERNNMVKAEKILKAALEKEETEATAALVKGTNNADNPVRNNASVDGSDNISPKQLKLKPKPKPIRQPEWVDDYKVPDPVIGRGRGKPREEPLAKPVKASHSKGPCALDSTVSDTPTASSQPQPAPQAKPQNILPKATENMTTSQKITVEIISKARNKVMSPEEAGKPLSNLEMSLMNSPLALPVAKIPAGAPVVLSPRERAMRSNASPRVNSFNFGSKKKESPRAEEGGSRTSADSSEVDAAVSVGSTNGSSNGAANGVVLGATPPVQAASSSSSAASRNHQATKGANNGARDNGTPSPSTTTTTRVPPIKKSPHVSPREVPHQPQKTASKEASTTLAPKSLSPRTNTSKDGSVSMVGIGPGGSAAKGSVPTQLTSQSAPSSVATSRQVKVPPISPQHTPRKLALHNEDGSGPQSPHGSVPSPHSQPPTQQGPQAESDKLKKKIALKELNEKLSNPNSPRSESPDGKAVVRPQIDFEMLDTLVASISAASFESPVV